VLSTKADKDVEDRGLWNNDNLQKTAEEAWAELPDAVDETSDIDRAARTLARILLLRGRLKVADPAEPVVMVVSNNWRMLGKSLGWKSAPSVDDGSYRLAGRVFIVPPNVSASYCADLPTGDLGDLLDQLSSEAHLSGLPALVLNPGAAVPELRLYPSGLSALDDKSSYPIHLAQLDLPSLDEALDRFHMDVVAAPGGGRKCAPLWQDADTFKVVSRPEKTIQNELFRFLRYTFPELRPIEEEDTPLGRFDIRLTGPVSQDETVVVSHAVIELKVIYGGNRKAPFTDTKAVKDHLQDGVRQAAGYRRPPLASRIAMMGCFDMRVSAGHRGESCLDHVRSFAGAENVVIRRWPLFPTVKALREYVVPAPA
jgi:hypothetical protein